MTSVELNRGVCEFLLDGVFLLWMHRESDKQAVEWEEGRGKNLSLHAGEHVQHALGMFRYLLKQLHEGEGEKNVLRALTAVGWSKGAGPSLTLANMHKVHIHTIRDELHLCIQAAVIGYARLQRCIHT